MIYFWPHAYLRDRQIDTIRHWPQYEVLNPELAYRIGVQVRKEDALSSGDAWRGWKQRVPLINVKFRPRSLPRETVVYVWGSVMATGDFVTDLDNPYSLTGYNLRAMRLYRPLLSRILSSNRCQEIRCISQACKDTLRQLFGDVVSKKATVHYPSAGIQALRAPAELSTTQCRFLFVGTQFEIKGGAALLRAFRKVSEQLPGARLDVVTHLPREFEALAAATPGVEVHAARFSRREIAERFFSSADVLVHPTYVETFGMIVLEALAHGLAIIGTDVYALREMVHSGRNGWLVRPPISIWDGVMPSHFYYDLCNIKRHIAECDTSSFEMELAQAMERMGSDRSLLQKMKYESLTICTAELLCSSGTV